MSQNVKFGHVIWKILCTNRSREILDFRLSRSLIQNCHVCMDFCVDLFVFVLCGALVFLLVVTVKIILMRTDLFLPYMFFLPVCHSLRAPPRCHIRSQRKRRNISTKTEMYVKARSVNSTNGVRGDGFSLVFFIHRVTAMMMTTA